ncbi:bromodomain-containing protein DDB_G0280777-like [Stegodyphus dumicola]|uniref:bromodomain-containing protein DDB_G0280777-like n=1 Tax=Stegodyphus dumicola TaxID=202533 RepID=UPI0015AB2CCA|nr:bromodomain-containing protein DDB_G0280777-like [Stegodyphus dumicola]
MHSLQKILILVFLTYTVTTADEKSKKDKKNSLPIQVILNPNGKRKTSEPAGSIIKRENKAIELEIHSGEGGDGKVDLIIAATKGIQATEESLDRYSPTYNAEYDLKNDGSPKNLKSNFLTNKNPGISRQDRNPFFSLPSIADTTPYFAMREILQHSQPLILGRSQFFPLENLKHFEQNLQREILPHSLEHGSVFRSNNIDSPFGAILPQPFFLREITPDLERQLRISNNPNVLGVAQYALIPQRPQNNENIGNLPQQIPIIQTPPQNRYPLINQTPQRDPVGNSQLRNYDRTEPHHSPYISSPQQNVVKNDGLTRVQEHSPPTHQQLPVPHRPLGQEISGKNYNTVSNLHNSVLPHRESEPSPFRHLDQNNVYQIQPPSANIGIRSHLLYHNPQLNQQQQMRNEQQIQQLYPVSQNAINQQQPSNPQGPVDYHPLLRTRIISQPEGALRYGDNQPLLKDLQTQLLPPPSLYHEQRYAVIPSQHSIAPQTPVLNNQIHQLSTSPQRPNLNNQIHDPISVSQRTALSNQASNLPQRSNLNNLHQPSTISQRPNLNTQFHQSSILSQRPNLNTQFHQRPVSQRPDLNYQARPAVGYASQNLHSFPRETNRVLQEDPKPIYRPQTEYQKSSNSQHPQPLHNSLSTDVRNYPYHRTSHEPAYATHSRTSLEEEESMDSKSAEHMVSPKSRRKFKPAEFYDSDDSLPQKKLTKSRKRGSIKEKTEDLQGHSSHQYIIKIG